MLSMQITFVVGHFDTIDNVSDICSISCHIYIPLIACNIHHITLHIPYTTHCMLHDAYTIYHTTYIIPHTGCGMQPTVYHILHTTWYMVHTVHIILCILHTACCDAYHIYHTTYSIPHTAYHILDAACRILSWV